MGWDKFFRELRSLLTELPTERFMVLAALAAMLIIAWAMKGA